MTERNNTFIDFMKLHYWINMIAMETIQEKKFQQKFTTA